MKDTEIRGLLLQKYYEYRRGEHGSWFLPEPSDFDNKLTHEDIIHVSAQLGEHGLIDWKELRSGSGNLFTGRGSITADGINVVEGTAKAPISITMNNQPITITGSSNVIVGNSNTQNINANIEAIIRAIQETKEPEDKKEEANGLFRKFLEHPLVSAITGGAIGLLR